MKRRIMEGTVQLIIDKIRTDMVGALIDLIADRPDNFVNPEPFRDFYIFSKAIGYMTPACFVLGRTIQFLPARGQNTINCMVGVQVSAIFEDMDGDRLVYLAWRYSDALHSILDRAQLVSTDGKVKNIVKLVAADFGDVVQIKGQVDSPFRKECMLTLEVEHIENET